MIKVYKICEVIRMKKICIVLSTIMVFSIMGCSTKSTPKTTPQQGTAQTKVVTKPKPVTTTTPIVVKPKYKDGTYTALDDKWSYGQESSTVTIKGGKIIYIRLKRLDTSGKEVNYNDWVGKKLANGEIKPNLKKFRIDMANRMLSKQTPNVDTIASATKSTSGWRVATQRALDKAK